MPPAARALARIQRACTNTAQLRLQVGVEVHQTCSALQTPAGYRLRAGPCVQGNGAFDPLQPTATSAATGEHLAWAEDEYVCLNLLRIGTAAGPCSPRTLARERPLRLSSRGWRQAPLTALCLGSGALGGCC